jgi:hypothetical protein
MTLIPIEFRSTQPSEDCGCPEENWLIGGIDLTIHGEADGTIHAFSDDGECQPEVTLYGFGSLDAARPTVFDWASATMQGLPFLHAGEAA